MKNSTILLINKLPASVNKIALRKAIVTKNRAYVLMATQGLDPTTRLLILRALDEGV